MSKNILVIGDQHAKPGVSNERFTLLGRLIADKRPDIVISIGDTADMPSLSLFDVGKKSFEGRRYKKDLESVWDAQDKLFGAIKEDNLRKKIRRELHYMPKFYMCNGNHEARISRAVESDPKLEGTMGLEDLKYEEYGWQVTGFKEPLYVQGILFQHFLTAGNYDRPIAGDNTGRLILKRYHSSAFVGHSHILNIVNEANAKGQLMWAGSVGCLMDHKEDYVSIQAQNNWWRGVVMLKDCENGLIDNIEYITLKSMQREYR